MQDDFIAYDAVERHPEIMYAILEWTWPFRAQYVNRNVIMEA